MKAIPFQILILYNDEAKVSATMLSPNPRLINGEKAKGMQRKLVSFEIVQKLNSKTAVCCSNINLRFKTEDCDGSVV